MLTKKINNTFYKSLRNSSPENLIINKLKFTNQSIKYKNKKIFEFNNKFYLISFGKASQSLTSGFLKSTNNIQDYFIVRHFVSNKYNINNKKSVISSHPLVSRKSYLAAKKLIKFIKSIPEKSNVIFLISGGGSAMLAHPIDGLDFNEKSSFINNLLHIGIGEREVNFFRKRLSSIKSSKILSFFKNNNILNIILSDERSNKIDAISSGLSIPQKQLKINDTLLNKVIGQKFCSKKISQLLQKNNKHIPPNHYNNKIRSIIIGDRFDLITQLKYNFKKDLKAKNVDYFGHIFDDTFEKSSTKIEKSIFKFYKDAKSGLNILIFTGEIPIKAKNNSKGGRNQHLSAYFIDRFKNFNDFSFGCYSTDGCDYLKGIHGAFIDDKVIKNIYKKNINFKKFINNTNTYYLHKAMGSLLKGKYSNNNFSDFYIFSCIK